MLATSEAHVRCRIWSAHDEFIRVIEDLWIAVCGRIAQCDRLSWSDRLSVEMHVLGSCAGEASIWAIQSKKLFHCRRDQCFVVPQPPLQVFVHREVVTY